jgi:two-component system chemotaxis response regulator CheY
MSINAIKSPCYLIVDDSPLGLRWLAQVLKNIDACEIIEASDGLVALEKLATAGDRVDAIISDLQMPNMNGLALLKEVRLATTGAIQSIPFFIVTGFAERALAGLALGLDVDAFLARPPKMQALRRHLLRTLGGRRPVKTAAEAQAMYGNVDVSLAMVPAGDLATEATVPPAVPIRESANGSIAVLDECLVSVETVPLGAHLARDAVNGAGAILLRAGEEMTASLKAVLMSYAEIDHSMSKVWVKQ